MPSKLEFTSRRLILKLAKFVRYLSKHSARHSYFVQIETEIEFEIEKRQVDRVRAVSLIHLKGLE